jgi:nicotinamidase-related amidase
VKLSRLDPAATALLLVDLQDRLLPAIQGHETIVARAELLLRGALELGLPVVATTQYARGLGATHPAIAALLPSPPIDKTAFGCFGSDDVRAALRATGRSQLLLAGVEAHICVLQTCLGAVEAGYDVHVVEDATGSRADRDRDLGLRRMERAGAILSSVEMSLYELLGRAGTPAFKKLLPLFR